MKLKISESVIKHLCFVLSRIYPSVIFSSISIYTFRARLALNASQIEQLVANSPSFSSFALVSVFCNKTADHLRQYQRLVGVGKLEQCKAILSEVHLSVIAAHKSVKSALQIPQHSLRMQENA